ncbi:MAG: hypothetical protein U0L09_01760 [Christensenellales bacterium]|nr:hypothetical protein [Christensenellales bacterium]
MQLIERIAFALLVGAIVMLVAFVFLLLAAIQPFATQVYQDAQMVATTLKGAIL